MGLTPYRTERRRGIAWNMEGTANLLEQIALNNLRDIDGEWDYNSYDAQEFRLLKKVRKTMLWQVKVMRAIARRMNPDA